MITQDLFNRVVAFLREKGFYPLGWGGTKLEEGKMYRVLQIRKNRRFKKPKKTWGTLWLEKDGIGGWAIYCWRREKADKLELLAQKLGEKFNVKVEFHVI